MSVRMTGDQMRAISTLEGDIAVRAGAGSGKTSVLAHRFAYALSNGVGGLDTGPDRLLTITFTSKAAAEIAERVRRVVRDEISLEQSRRIEQGWISTIHAFCARLVRRHLLEAGLDASFGQADEVTASALKSEAFERAAHRCLDADPSLAALFDTMSLKELQSRVIACHDKARTLGLDPAMATVSLEPSDLVPLVERVLDDSRELGRSLEGLRETASVMASCEALASWTEELSSCPLDDDAGDHLVTVCDAYAVRGSAGTKEAHARLKDSLGRLRRAALAFRHAGEMAGIEQLIRRYRAEYQAVKSERGLLDFDDLQELAVSLLERDPTVAAHYRNHFDLLMIDEFQDTNALQMRVLAPLRRHNLCIVGDERQSIYGFRFADVSIFTEATKAVEREVGLRANFRSHEAVLGFINGVFGHDSLFGSEFMQLEAGRHTGWAVGGLEAGPRVECVFVHNGEKMRAARLAEAAHVAGRIESLVAHGCGAGSIAILLRNATNAGLYAAELERRGVATLVNAGSSLYDTPEITELMSLLRTVAVPEDDEALLSVLSSRIVALADATLLAISRAAEGGSLWSALCRLADEPQAPGGIDARQFDALRWARDGIETTAALQGRLGLGQLVQQACEVFDYDVTLHAQGTSGVRAWANVRKVVRLAEAFERAEANDLAEFVEHLRLRETAAPDKPAPGDADGQAVRIMTIHAAKGLQFPVVFVADLAAPKRHAAPSVLVESMGEGASTAPVVGVRLPKEPYGAATTPSYLAMADAHVAREVEEEKRCLYVACTRAEELLVVSGATDLDKDSETGPALIDWIREATGPASEGRAQVGGYPVSVDELRPEPAVSATEIEAPAEHAEALCPPGRHEVAEAPASPTLPSTVSYSALHLYEQCPLSFHATYGLRMGRPSIKEEPSSLSFGSAVHAALRWEVRGGLTDERIEAIVRSRGLSREDRQRLARTVTGFSESALAARVREADRVATEEPLLVGLAETVLVGSIDLIAWEGEQALIIDYKTGKAPGGDTDRDQAYRLQAECYALAALEAGASDVEVRFVFVEHPDAVRDFAFCRADGAGVRRGLESVVRRIKTEEPHHLDSYHAEVCERCPALGGLCPVKAPSRRAQSRS